MSLLRVTTYYQTGNNMITTGEGAGAGIGGGSSDIGGDGGYIEQDEGY